LTLCNWVLHKSKSSAKLDSHHFQPHRAATIFFALLLRENIYGSTIRQHGDLEEPMTFSELIEQTRIERANVAAQLQCLDAALAALTKIAPGSAAPKASTGRTWTTEQKAKLSASLKRVLAAKRAAARKVKA
jgi:hypothetical protein